MTDIDALVQRLRDERHLMQGDGLSALIATASAAADALTAERAKVAALQAAADGMDKALRLLHHAVCGKTGFAEAVRYDSGLAYPWPALDAADKAAQAALTTYQQVRGG